MPVISPDQTIAQIVAANPEAQERLAELGIDNCCGAHATLQEHCHRLRLDPGAVVAHLMDSSAPAEPTETADLCSMIRASIERLLELGRRVAAAHGARDARLGELLAVLERLEHCVRRRPRVSCLAAPLDRAAIEGQAAELLARAAELTDGFTVPAQACGTWTQLVNVLRGLHARSLPTTSHAAPG